MLLIIEFEEFEVYILHNVYNLTRFFTKIFVDVEFEKRDLKLQSVSSISKPNLSLN